MGVSMAVSEASYQTPCTVAVVDDDPDVREFLSEAILSVGCRVLPFENGQALWVHDHLDTIDLFILDIGLPLINGITLAHSLRQRIEVRDKRIVALTGGSTTSPAEAFRAGFDEYWLKPLNLGLLFATLKEAMQERRERLRAGT